MGPVASPRIDPLFAHFVLYLVLGALVAFNVYYLKGRQRILLCFIAALLVGVFWGVLTESLQIFVPNRVASSEDVFINVISAAFGGLMVAVLVRKVGLPTYRTHG